MHLINPICEANIKPHLGKHVCVVLTDGTTIYGTLGSFDGQQLILKSCLEAGTGVGSQPVSTSNAKSNKPRSVKKHKKAKTSAWGGLGYGGYGAGFPGAGFGPGFGGYPYGGGFGGGFGGGSIALSVATIALLFALPFLLI